MSNFFTLCKPEWRSREVALLFSGPNSISPDVQEQIMCDSFVRDRFPGGAVARVIDEGLLVESGRNQATKNALLPDSAEEPGNFVVINRVGNVGMVVVDPYEKFRQCFSLVKHTIGCGECPERARCLTGMSEGYPDYGVEQDDFDAKIAAGTEIAGFKYVSPRVTGNNPFQFWRTPEDHRFTDKQIVSRRMALTDTCQTAAQTRAFKKLVCPTCPAAKSCEYDGKWTARNCDGPYPNTERLTAAVLENWDPRIAAVSTMAPWQFWSLAYGCSRTPYINLNRARRRNRAYEYALDGLVWHGDEFVSRLCRVHGTGAGDCETGGYRLDYNSLREMGFDLPRNEAEAKMRGIVPLEGESRALYFWTLEQRRSHHERRGWGHGGSPHIVRRQWRPGPPGYSTPGRVEVSVHRYTRRIELNDFTIETWKDAFYRLGRVSPLNHINIDRERLIGIRGRSKGRKQGSSSTP